MKNFCREGIPDEFRQIHVRFVADNQVIKAVKCAYGEPVPEAEIPQAPEKEGYYTIWEEADLGEVLVDRTIHAVYRPYVTAIASSEEKMPMVLAEGIFYPDASIEAEEGKLQDGIGTPTVTGQFGQSVIRQTLEVRKTDRRTPSG